MARSANVTISIEPSVKRQADALFSAYGINFNDAVSLLIRRAIIEQSLPVEVVSQQPNAVTQAAFDRVEAMVLGEIPYPSTIPANEFFAEIEREMANEI
jgi:DNA-damage-inducible protein J